MDILTLLKKYILGAIITFSLYPLLSNSSYNLKTLGLSLVMALGIPIGDIVFREKNGIKTVEVEYPIFHISETYKSLRYRGKITQKNNNKTKYYNPAVVGVFTNHL